MTTVNRLQCSKVVMGDCSPDLVVQPGEDITWLLTIKNPTAQVHTVNVAEELPSLLFTGITPVTVTPVYANAVGTSPTSLPFTDTVTLQPGGSAVYTIIATVPAEAPCGAEITNVAMITPADVPTCCDERKFVTAKTVRVLPDDRECDPDCLFPTSPNGTRPVDHRQVLWAFLGGDNEQDGQFIQDCLTMGLTLADVLRALRNGGLL